MTRSNSSTRYATSRRQKGGVRCLRPSSWSQSRQRRGGGPWPLDPSLPVRSSSSNPSRWKYTKEMQRWFVTWITTMCTTTTYNIIIQAQLVCESYLSLEVVGLALDPISLIVLRHFTTCDCWEFCCLLLASCSRMSSDVLPAKQKRRGIEIIEHNNTPRYYIKYLSTTTKASFCLFTEASSATTSSFFCE